MLSKTDINWWLNAILSHYGELRFYAGSRPHDEEFERLVNDVAWT